jgi:DUF3040 family protein
VALSDDEQRRLEEIERAFDRHLPRFATDGSDNQRRERRWVAAAAVMGLVVLLTGLVLHPGVGDAGRDRRCRGNVDRDGSGGAVHRAPTDRLRRGIRAARREETAFGARRVQVGPVGGNSSRSTQRAV